MRGAHHYAEREVSDLSRGMLGLIRFMESTKGIVQRRDTAPSCRVIATAYLIVTKLTRCLSWSLVGEVLSKLVVCKSTALHLLRCYLHRHFLMRSPVN